MRRNYNHTRTSAAKPITVVIALALTAALLAGGAFAWTDFNQSRTNKFRGTFDADVTLHDEFDGEDKDVFVENTGMNPIYVRVRFDEYMQVGDTVFDPNADVHDKTTWTVHTYDGEDFFDCEKVNPAKPDDPDASLSCLFHDYYTWEMSGAGRTYTPGVPGMVYTKLGADGKVDADSGTQQTAVQSDPIRLSFLHAIFESQNPDNIDFGNIDPDIVKEYMDKIDQGCWVLDDTATPEQGGGWAYWSKALAPMTYKTDGTVESYGEATNLLLDSVVNIKEAEEDWIYRIDVKLQAVTLGDTDTWNDDSVLAGSLISESAKGLIAHWKTPANSGQDDDTTQNPEPDTP